MTLLAQDEKVNSDDDVNIIKLIFHIILRNKRFIAMMFLAIVVALYIVIINLTYQFESSAQLIVKLGRDNTRAPLTVENASVYSNGVKREDINSYIKLLSSENLIYKSINDIGYDRFTSEPAPQSLWQHIKFGIKSTIRFFKSQVSNFVIFIGLKPRLTENQKVEDYVKKVFNVVLLRDSNVIQISMKLPDPQLARDFIQTHIINYKAAHIKVNQREVFYTAFKEQTDLYEAKLKSKQQELELIKAAWNIFSPKEQTVKVLTDMQVIRTKIQDETAKIQQYEAQKKQLLALNETIPQRYKMQEDFELNPYSVQLKKELSRLKLKRSSNPKLYSKKSKNGKKLNARIKELQRTLNKKKDKISSAVSYQPNPLAEDINKKITFLNVDIDGLKASIIQDKKYLDELDAEINKLNKGTILLATKELEYTVLEKRFLLSAARLEQVTIDKQLDMKNISNVAILSPATLPSKPKSPKKALLFLVGAVAGLIASCGIAIFREWMIETINDENDINTIADVKFLGYFSS